MAYTGPGKAHRDGISLLELAEMFPDEDSAREWFEAIVWPNGRWCPGCEGTNTHECSHAKMPYRCRDCRKYFSVKTGEPVRHEQKASGASQRRQPEVIIPFGSGSAANSSRRGAVSASIVRSSRPTHGGFSTELLGRFDTADRLAPLMVSASQIAGNPRLIKRFLNALSIRMAIARTHNVAVDEAVLAKLMLFERSGPAKAYAELIKVVNENEDGRPTFLASWEQRALAGQELELDSPWDDAFVLEWLTLQPRLADIDLRGALYVSREHTPLVTPEDRLSSRGAELLTAILESPDMAGDLRAQLEQLPRTEATVIMDRVLASARQQQEWGTPPILDAALAVAAADPTLGLRLAGFLQERPPGQVTASIVPKINGHHWTSMVYDRWLEADVGSPVKRAIEQQAAPANRR